MKRIARLSAVLLSVVVFLSAGAYAVRLLTEQEALDALFGTGAQVTTETKDLKGADLAKVKSALGNKLYYDGKGATSAGEKIEFFIATKNGQRVGAAYRDTEPGKWGPVEFMTCFDPDGKVSKVVVMSYEEKRGAGIARSSYLGQYKGKSMADPLVVGKDITGITGATVSSQTATFAVKKALALYDTLFHVK